MKHVQYFEDFLDNEVNLNETRLKRLNDSVSAVSEFLRNNLDSYKKTERQGSYALRTIIKPINNHEYDADILLLVKYDPDKEPKDYINELYNCLKGNKTYKADKVHRKTRCVYIDYVGDFHLDIVPCITYGSNQYICNNKENVFRNY